MRSMEEAMPDDLEKTLMRYAVMLGALLAGCASLNETQCRSTDWYQQGQHDALMGNRPKIDLYAQQCSRYQVQPSEKDYMAGWALGYSEWNQRVSDSRM